MADDGDMRTRGRLWAAAVSTVGAAVPVGAALKKFTAGLIALFTAAAVIAASAAPSYAIFDDVKYYEASPTTSRMYIDGEEIDIVAFNIANYNYFKIRTLAMVVDCSIWYVAASDTIYIDSEKTFADSDYFLDPTIGFLAGDSALTKVTASKYLPSIEINGKNIELESFNIGGFNYVKLRDFLPAIGAGVRYDQDTDSIYVDTDIGYDPDYTGRSGDEGRSGKEGRPGRQTTYIGEEETPLGSALFGEDDPRGQQGRSVGSPGAPSDNMEFRMRVVDIMNAERAARGLNPLIADDSMFEIAQYKSEDMANVGYFDHTSPAFGDMTDLFEMFDIEYSHIGENIAIGQDTPEIVMEDWMNSPGHRANILDSDYTHIGIGLSYNEDGEPLWTQSFLRKPDN